jgi:hypothetical protein
VRFEIKNIFFYFEKCSLLQRWGCSCVPQVFDDGAAGRVVEVVDVETVDESSLALTLFTAPVQGDLVVVVVQGAAVAISRVQGDETSLKKLP